MSNTTQDSKYTQSSSSSSSSSFLSGCQLCQGEGKIIADNIKMARDPRKCSHCDGNGSICSNDRMPLLCEHCVGSGIVNPFMNCPDKSHKC